MTEKTFGIWTAAIKDLTYSGHHTITSEKQSGDALAVIIIDFGRHMVHVENLDTEGNPGPLAQIELYRPDSVDYIRAARAAAIIADLADSDEDIEDAVNWIIQRAN